MAGTKLRDINPRMGEADDPEKWRDISEAVNKTSVVKSTGHSRENFREVVKCVGCIYRDAELNRKKGENGPGCWALGFCTAEIVDAIVRNTRVVLPVSTYICVRDVIESTSRKIIANVE